MKKIILFLSLITSLSTVAQEQFTITGTLPDDSKNGTTIYINELEDQSYNYKAIDSCKIENKTFKLKGSIADSPKVGFLTGTRTMFGLVILEAGNISIDIVLDQPQVNKIKGTKNNDEFQTFFNEQYDIVKQIQAFEKPSPDAPEQKPLFDNLATSTTAYIKKNIKNNIGEFLILDAAQVLPKEQVLSLLAQTRPKFANGIAATELKTTLQSYSIGDTYTDIRLPDPSGKEIALSDYVGKNKIVLIDFWESWCGPCRKEMPTVVEAYQKYKSKGFEIVGISLDQEKGAWIQSTKALNITWPQMSDLGGWKSKAAQLYKINSIPATFLLDQNGRIIAKNLRGEELLSKLDELLK